MSCPAAGRVVFHPTFPIADSYTFFSIQYNGEETPKTAQGGLGGDGGSSEEQLCSGAPRVDYGASTAAQ